MSQRNSQGYTLIELMVAMSILVVVTGLIYSSYNQGWSLFSKSFQFGKVQTDARAALEEMCFKIKQANKDLIYVGDSFDTRIPLPKDAIFGKPYLYFAVAGKAGQQAQVQPQAKTDKVSNKISRDLQYPPYDYYLYYLARAKNEDGEPAEGRAKLKLLIIKDQDGEYTFNNIRNWPVLPLSLVGKANYEDEPYIRKKGFLGTVKYQDLSPEFSLYHSEFSYFYNNANYKSLFKIRVKMIDPQTKTNIEFETAVTPRN